MNRRARILLIVVLVFLFGGGAAYGWRAYSNRKKLEAFKAKVPESMKQAPPGGGPPFGRRGGSKEIRGEAKNLPELYSKKFFGSMRLVGMPRAYQRVDGFLAMNKADRQHYLGPAIAVSVKRRTNT